MQKYSLQVSNTEAVTLIGLDTTLDIDDEIIQLAVAIEEAINTIFTADFHMDVRVVKTFTEDITPMS